jgi:ParB-like chromosome segregation protein Spo0J
MRELINEIRRSRKLSERKRVAFYNALMCELGELVADICPDPACAPQLVAVDELDPNGYNPNTVATPELDLLEQSMRADGITMSVVATREGRRHSIVDGFHRFTVAVHRLGRRYLPCSIIDHPLADRMASTVRHNRARGKHQVELMGVLVKSMIDLGWSDERIAEALGMSVEELLRLKQTVGAAVLLAGQEYTRAWKGRDGEDSSDKSTG